MTFIKLTADKDYAFAVNVEHAPAPVEEEPPPIAKCKMCGRPSEFIRNGGSGSFRVQCAGCPEHTCWYETKVEAAAVWNEINKM